MEPLVSREETWRRLKPLLARFSARSLSEDCRLLQDLNIDGDDAGEFWRWCKGHSGRVSTAFCSAGIDGPDGAQSSGADFQKAYNADTPLMTPGEDDYYLDKHSGPSEAYAESFARYFGGDPTLQQDWPNMYNYWAGQYPNVSPGQPWPWSLQSDDN